MSRIGVPGQNISPLAYADGRLPVVPMVQGPRRPLTTDKKYPMWCEWRVLKNPSTGTEGEFWKLIRFESNGDATWVKISDTGTGIDSVGVDANTGPGTDPVVPDTNGLITVTGAQVASGVVGANVIRTDSLAANTYTIEVQQTDAVAAKDTTKNGVAHFDSAIFTDDEGFVSLANYIPKTAWTPSVDGAVSGPPTITVQAGNYSRTGTIVNIQLELTWTAVNGASGDVIISGFPITFPGSLSRNPLGVCWVEIIAWPASRTQCLLWGLAGTTTAKVYVAGTGVSPSLLQMAANGTIHGNFTFSL